MSCAARGEHERGFDALLVHQREPQVAVAVGLRLLAERLHQLGALLVAQVLERVQAVEQHPRHAQRQRRVGGDLARCRWRRAAEQLGELLGRVGDLRGGELRRLPREELHPLARGRIRHVADGEAPLRRVDVPLVQVHRLVEVVVGVEDRVRAACSSSYVQCIVQRQWKASDTVRHVRASRQAFESIARCRRATSSERLVRVVVYSRMAPPAAWITRPLTSAAAGDAR